MHPFLLCGRCQSFQAFFPGDSNRAFGSVACISFAFKTLIPFSYDQLKVVKNDFAYLAQALGISIS
jgi:hypothetical protein